MRASPPHAPHSLPPQSHSRRCNGCPAQTAPPSPSFFFSPPPPPHHHTLLRGRALEASERAPGQVRPFGERAKVAERKGRSRGGAECEAEERTTFAGGEGGRGEEKMKRTGRRGEA